MSGGRGVVRRVAGTLKASFHERQSDTIPERVHVCSSLERIVTNPELKMTAESCAFQQGSRFLQSKDAV